LCCLFLCKRGLLLRSLLL
nr:immunoglobulin heavy chain junction region [Mus musculus]